MGRGFPTLDKNSYGPFGTALGVMYTSEPTSYTPQIGRETSGGRVRISSGIIMSPNFEGEDS